MAATTKNIAAARPATEVFACGACEAAELAPGGVGEVRGAGRVAGRGAGRGPGPATSQLPAPANHVKDLPNLARMARQYLGVPATSATVERLFSVVGFAFADRRKSQSAETLANLAFAKLNLPTSKLQ